MRKGRYSFRADANESSNQRRRSSSNIELESRGSRIWQRCAEIFLKRLIPRIILNQLQRVRVRVRLRNNGSIQCLLSNYIYQKTDNNFFQINARFKCYQARLSHALVNCGFKLPDWLAKILTVRFSSKFIKEKWHQMVRYARRQWLALDNYKKIYIWHD